MYISRKKIYRRIQNWYSFVSTWSRLGDNGDQRLVTHIFHSAKSGKNRSLAMDFRRFDTLLTNHKQGKHMAISICFSGTLNDYFKAGNVVCVCM